MTVPVLVLGSGVATAGLYAWIALAMLILLGDKIIWWATERIGERSLIQADGDASSTWTRLKFSSLGKKRKSWAAERAA